MRITAVAGAHSGRDLRPVVLDALRILAQHGQAQSLANIAAVAGHLLPREPPGLVLAVAQALDALEREGRVRSVLTPRWRVWLLEDPPPGRPRKAARGGPEARGPPGELEGPLKAARDQV